MTLARLAGLVAAAAVAATGLVGVTSVPASAALCSGGGVNVVVDFQGLGGGVQKGCDPQGANRSSDKVFPAAGFGLTYAQREPGFVCRVKGKSQDDPCVNASPTNAYWGLYWSDGKSGKWTYATTGVSGLSVPKGGFVAFSWQNGGDADPPGAAPVNQQSTPTPKPTKAPPKAPSGGGGAATSTKAAQPTKPGTSTATTAAPTPSASASARAVARAKAKARAKASASASASASPSASASSSVSPPSEDSNAEATENTSGEFAPDKQDDGLPVWVPIVVLLGLGGAAGAAIWWRRRTGAA